MLVSEDGTMPVMVPDDRYGRDPLDALSRAERLICGPLVLRQLRHGGRRIERELKKYGPEGTVLLCSAQAFGIVEVAFVVVGIVLAASGQGLAAGICITVGLVAAVLGVIRAASAGIAGRRWRSTGQAEGP